MTITRWKNFPKARRIENSMKGLIERQRRREATRKMYRKRRAQWEEYRRRKESKG